MNSVVWKSALSVCLLVCASMPWAADAPLATATVVDGETVLIRGASRLQLAEGVRLAKDDIVESTPKARFVRIEFGDGVILDLGPAARVLLTPKLSGDRSRMTSRLHLLQGAAKLTVPSSISPSAITFSSPAFDVTSMARTAVFLVQADAAYAFSESGGATLLERRGGKATGTTVLENGEFFARQGEAKATVSARPTQAFIQQLPRAFLDTLPARAARFKERPVEPRALGDIGFREAEAWIDADGLRSQFVTRWKPLARNPAFREGLVANLRAHPEWDRVLYPEKYLPKPASASASAAAARPVPRNDSKP
jgi:hypothetical protein